MQFICSCMYQEKKRQKIHSRHICMYFDGSCCSFQRLLVCCAQRHYIHVPVCTIMCLCSYMDYILVHTYTNICTYMFAYVSLRQYMNVGGLRSYMCQYVLICKYALLFKNVPLTKIFFCCIVISHSVMNGDFFS